MLNAEAQKSNFKDRSLRYIAVKNKVNSPTEKKSNRHKVSLASKSEDTFDLKKQEEVVYFYDSEGDFYYQG